MSESLELSRDGAVLVAGALGPAATEALRTGLAKADRGKAGTRVHGVEGLAPVLAVDGAVGAVAARWLGPAARAVRAVLFDKSAANNWALGWHQDRTIVVARRGRADGFGAWSVKSGLVHVAPPMDVLERMLTLRVHLDDAGPGNAPLLIAAGSHRLGRIPVEAIQDVVAESDIRACPAAAGDVWVYSTPVVHASNAALFPTRRRVLQVDYAAFDLPGGLEWLGV